MVRILIAAVDTILKRKQEFLVIRDMRVLPSIYNICQILWLPANLAKDECEGKKAKKCLAVTTCFSDITIVNSGRDLPFLHDLLLSGLWCASHQHAAFILNLISYLFSLHCSPRKSPSSMCHRHPSYYYGFQFKIYSDRHCSYPLTFIFSYLLTLRY